MWANLTCNCYSRNSIASGIDSNHVVRVENERSDLCATDYKYPFDHQIITWTIEVSGNNGDPVHLFNCHGGGRSSSVLRGMNLTRTPLRVHGEEVSLDEVLLPATGEWWLDGDLEDAVRRHKTLTISQSLSHLCAQLRTKPLAVADLAFSRIGRRRQPQSAHMQSGGAYP